MTTEHKPHRVLRLAADWKGYLDDNEGERPEPVLPRDLIELVEQLETAQNILREERRWREEAQADAVYVKQARDRLDAVLREIPRMVDEGYNERQLADFAIAGLEQASYPASSRHPRVVVDFDNGQVMSPEEAPPFESEHVPSPASEPGEDESEDYYIADESFPEPPPVSNQDTEPS